MANILAYLGQCLTILMIQVVAVGGGDEGLSNKDGFASNDLKNLTIIPFTTPIYVQVHFVFHYNLSEIE